MLFQTQPVTSSIALADGCCGFGRSIQRCERAFQLTRLKLSLGKKAQPLRTEHAGAGGFPGGQPGAKFCDPLHRLAETDQSETSADARLREPLR